MNRKGNVSESEVRHDELVNDRCSLSKTDYPMTATLSFADWLLPKIILLKLFVRFRASTGHWSMAN
jgi:hypothetical protein